MQLSDDFVSDLRHPLMFWSHIAYAPKKGAFGHAGAKSKSKTVNGRPCVLHWATRTVESSRKKSNVLARRQPL